MTRPSGLAYLSKSLRGPALAVALCGVAVSGALAESIRVDLDYARVIKLDRAVSRVIIGSSRHDGLLHRASHRTGHADHASGSLDWSIKMPAQAGQIPAGC